MLSERSCHGRVQMKRLRVLLPGRQATYSSLRAQKPKLDDFSEKDHGLILEPRFELAHSCMLMHLQCALDPDHGRQW